MRRNELPDFCLSTLPYTGQLIILRKGECGYYASDWDIGKREENQNIAREHNRRRGISDIQEAAMRAGSMFGWHTPGADPQWYLDNARYVNAIMAKGHIKDPVIRSIIRADIDRIIGEAYTYETFLMLLRQEGYVVRNAPSRKYVTVLPPGGKRAIRLDSLGEGYTEQDIRRRLAAQREGSTLATHTFTHTGRRYRIKGRRPIGTQRKIKGFQALYLRYLYLLRGTRRKKNFRRVPFSVRQEVIRLQRYDRQFRYLWANGMTTAEDLEQRIAALEREIYDGEQQRKPLYRERRNAEDEAYKTQCSAEIDRQTAALREKRRELAMCRRILEDVPLVSRQVQQAEEERQEDMKKEVRKHEYQR